MPGFARPMLTWPGTMMAARRFEHVQLPAPGQFRSGAIFFLIEPRPERPCHLGGLRLRRYPSASFDVSGSGRSQSKH